MVKLIVQARKWWGVLADGKADLTALAEREGVNDSYIARVVRAAFLSPEVIDATRRQPAWRARAAKLRTTDGIPASWREQRARFLPQP